MYQKYYDLQSFALSRMDKDSIVYKWCIIHNQIMDEYKKKVTQEQFEIEVEEKAAVAVEQALENIFK